MYKFGDIETIDLRRNGVLIQKFYNPSSDEPYLEHVGGWRMHGMQVDFENVFAIASHFNRQVKSEKPRIVDAINGMYFQKIDSKWAIVVFDELDEYYKRIAE